MTSDDEAVPAGERTAVRLVDMPRGEMHRAIALSLARAIVVSTLLVVAYYVLPLAASASSDLALRAVLAGIAIVVIVAWQVWAVSRAELPQLRALEALASTVTLLLVTFAGVYLSLSMRDALAFNEPFDRTASLYFTMTTFTTVGYGDLAAVTDAARVAVMVQMIFNVVFIGLAVKAIFATARHRLRRNIDIER